MSRHRSLVVLLLVLLVAFAGCSAGGGDSGGPQQIDPDNGGVAVGGGDGGGGDAGAREPDAGDGGDGAQLTAIQNRQIIQTGRVSLEVDSFENANRNLSEAAAEYGGFVSDSSQERHRIGNETYLTGVVVLRVPQDNFTALKNRIEAEGTVLRSSTSSNDVTDQLVDIEARLDNLRAQREQLRQLYERANTTEDILAVQDRLTAVQTEIERLEARQQSLERQVALSTITVELAEPRPQIEPPDRDQWYEIGVIDAFLESIHGVQVVLRALVVAIAYALPYLIVFGAPLLGLLGFILWWERRS